MRVQSLRHAPRRAETHAVHQRLQLHPQRPATITHKHVHRESPGVFIINASATIRAVNRSLGWQLPTDGPKTLNGLLVEKLETLPESGDRVEIDDYQFEVLQIGENTIRTVRARRVATPTAS